MATQQNYWAWNENINGRYTKCNSLYNNVSISHVVNGNFTLTASVTTPDSFLDWQGFIGGPKGAFWMGLHSGKWCVGKQYGNIEEFCHFGAAEKNKRCEIMLEREGRHWSFYIDDIFAKSAECQRSECIQTQQVTIGAGYDNGNEPWNGGVHFIAICPLEQVHSDEKKADSTVEPETNPVADQTTAKDEIRTAAEPGLTTTCRSDNKSEIITVFDKVVRKCNNDVGIVRFVGEIAGKIGIFYGIDLEQSNGKNDGSYNNRYYFKTDEECGVFVRRNKINLLSTNNVDLNIRITVGDIVHISKYDSKGIVRFIGETQFKPAIIWYGVQLERSNGKNNGKI